MSRPTAAQLHQFARDERARRKAAWQSSGKGLSDRAQQDDAIWSNIEQKAGRFAGDPAAVKRNPWYWTRPEIETMMANARATAIKAETSLDHGDPAQLAKIVALWHLFRWLQNPEPYRPAVQAAEGTIRPRDAITRAAEPLGAKPADFPHHWEVPGKPVMSTGQMLFLAADARFEEEERAAA